MRPVGRGIPDYPDRSDRYRRPPQDRGAGIGQVTSTGWQLGVPFWVGPDKQLVEPSRPGAPVPATMDRMLAEMAIEHMVRVNWPGLRQRLRVTKVIDWANRHRSLT